VSTVAIIQARMGSTRLPGKVLRDLGGRPMLEHVVRRVRAARGVDAVCVATTRAEGDDEISALGERCGAEIFRGSEDDVLGRYAGAARRLGTRLVVRVTADCPLYDPDLLAEMLAARQRLVAETGPVDYYSNCGRRTYPRGLDTEILPAEVLALADREATDPFEREHVTPFVRNRPERFRLEDHLNPDGDWSALRWTVDEPEDFELVRRIYSELGGGEIFGRHEVRALLERRPEWLEINAGVRQKRHRSGSGHES